MIEIIQAPNIETVDGIRLFIAGGISNCPNWQDELTDRLLVDKKIKNELIGHDYINISVFNPRCKGIPEEDAQIKWEYERLQTSNIISFWFSVGSLNPITLFEYGAHFKSKEKTIIVGCHKDYDRKNNVIRQSELASTNIDVKEKFEDFYNNIVEVLIEKIENRKVSDQIIDKV